MKHTFTPYCLLSFLLIFSCVKGLAQDPVKQWDQTIGGSSTDNLYCGALTSDGGYILGGYSSSGISGDKTEAAIGSGDIWIVKLDNAGNILWQNTIGTTVVDFISDIVQTDDGGYLIGGYTAAGISGDKTEVSNGSYDYWVIKLSSTGSISWQNSIGGSGADYLKDIELSAGGYILSGYSDSGISGDKTDNCLGGYDYWIMKIDLTGSILWQYTKGGSDDDYLQKSKRNADGNYILCGNSDSNISGDKNENCLGGRDYWIACMDESGNFIWQNTIGGDSYDIVSDFLIMDSGNIILAGNSSSDISGDKSTLSYSVLDADYDDWFDHDLEDTYDFWIVKIDKTGEIIWEKTFGKTSEEYVKSVFFDAADRILVAGYSWSESWISEYKTIAIDTNGYFIWKDDLYGQFDDMWDELENDDNELTCAIPVPGNGYLLCGYSNANTGYDKSEDVIGPYQYMDFWILKMAPDTCTTSPLYFDYDKDLMGGNQVGNACEIEASTPYAFNNSDCDDFNSSVYSGAPEMCDGIDNNCNGSIDEGLIDCYPGPAIISDKTIGGNNDDILTGVFSNPDGTKIIGGTTSSITGDITENNGLEDLCIIKLGIAGEIMWSKIIGGSDNDELKSVEQTSDGGYIIAATSYSGISGNKTETNWGDADYWIIKLDASGNIIWQNNIGGITYDFVTAAHQTNDGGYIIGGTSDSHLSGDKTETIAGGVDYWILKLDSTGNIQWQNTIGGYSDDNLTDIHQTSDGGYIAGGYSRSGITAEKTITNYGGEDFWIIKLNADGTIAWQRGRGGALDDRLGSIVEKNDGGYFAVGSSQSGASIQKSQASVSFDFWLIEWNASGGFVWEKTISADIDDFCTNILKTEDNSYLIAGYSNSNMSYDKNESHINSSAESDFYYYMEEGESDFWLIKIDSVGNIIWQNTIGGNMNDIPCSISKSIDGTLLIGGTSGSFQSGDKTENQKGVLEEIPTDGEYYEYALADKDFWFVELEEETCFPVSEECNSIDDNCNGIIDDGITETISIFADGPVVFCPTDSVILHAEFSGETIQWFKNGNIIPGATNTFITTKKKGFYSCETYSNCDTVLSNTIFVNPLKGPPASIIADSPVTFCEGESVTLSANTGIMLSYQWFKNGELIPGANTINYLAITEGNYKCMVIKAFTGCYKMSNTISVTVPCKAGEWSGVSGESGFPIYPNPNNGTFILSAQSAKSAPACLGCEAAGRGENIQIYNSLGQLIYTEQVNSSDNNFSQTISLDNISSGIYFVRVGDGNYYSEHKLIIEK